MIRSEARPLCLKPGRFTGAGNKLAPPLIARKTPRPFLMRILVAPDKFAGTLTARQAGEAIAAGWHRHAPSTRAQEPAYVARPGPSIRVMTARWSPSCPSRSPTGGKP